MENEIWKDVPGYENRYHISTFGNVFSVKYKRQIKPQLRKADGGFVIAFRIGKKRKVFGIHQLVALAFIPNPLKRTEIDHKDNDRGNNHIDNLQWCTRGENIRWAYERGRDRKSGEASKAAIFTNKQANQIREEYLNGARPYKIRSKYGCSETALWAILNYQSYRVC